MFKRKKSSYCGSGQCVEVEAGIAVRVWETGRDDGLTVNHQAWHAFMALVKSGAVDG